MADTARLLQTQPSTLTRWFRGSKPQRHTLIPLAEALRVDLAWLAAGNGPAPSWEKNTIEQTPPSNRLEEMSYHYPSDGDPAAIILAALSTEELLTLAERLGPSPAVLSTVLAAVRRRTSTQPLSYLKKS